MARRLNRRGVDPFNFFADPGKDIFSYLFLIMLFFTFMLLTANVVKDGSPLSDPVGGTSGGKNNITLSDSVKAIKKNNEIFLESNGHKFQLSQDSLKTLSTKLVEQGLVDDKQNPVAFLLIDESVEGIDVPKITMMLNNAGITVQFVK